MVFKLRESFQLRSQVVQTKQLWVASLDWSWNLCAFNFVYKILELEFLSVLYIWYNCLSFYHSFGFSKMYLRTLIYSLAVSFSILHTHKLSFLSLFLKWTHSFIQARSHTHQSLSLTASFNPTLSTHISTHISIHQRTHQHTHQHTHTSTHTHQHTLTHTHILFPLIQFPFDFSFYPTWSRVQRALIFSIHSPWKSFFFEKFAKTEIEK